MLADYNVVVTGKYLVRAVGIGPTTRGLKGRCSTTELRPQTEYIQMSKAKGRCSTTEH